MKTEHNGAKNGGGHWGTRREAKAMSHTARRQQDARANLRHMIRQSDRCHYVTPFGSPAYMSRAEAQRYLRDDLKLWDELRVIDPDQLVGQRQPYIEG